MPRWNKEDVFATLAPEARAFVESIRSSGAPPLHLLTPAEARAAYDAGRQATRAETLQAVERVADLTLSGPAGKISARCYRPLNQKSQQALPVIIYFHGGGWVLGGLDSFDSVCRKLAHASGCLLYSIDYRLAPEHRFPAQIDDGWASLNGVAERCAEDGGDPTRIAVAGDSGGGTIAAVVCLLAREHSPGKVAYQCLLYPSVDLRQNTESYRLFAEGFNLTVAAANWFRKHFSTPDTKLDDWRHSPLLASDHGNLPPALVLTASHDPLRDQGEAYAMRLAAAGNIVTLTRCQGQLHGFIGMDGYMKAADPAIAIAGRAIADGLRPGE